MKKKEPFLGWMSAVFLPMNYRPGTVEHRGRVDEDTGTVLLPGLVFDASQQSTHLALHHVVIVGAIGVFRDFVMARIAQKLFRIVVVEHRDDTSGAFDEQARVVAFFLVAVEVLHVAFMGLREPLLHVGGFFMQGSGGGDATGIEAELLGFSDDPLGIHQNGANVRPTESGWITGASWPTSKTGPSW